jgi:hypothetical protein
MFWTAFWYVFGAIAGAGAALLALLLVPAVGLVLIALGLRVADKIMGDDTKRLN